MKKLFATIILTLFTTACAQSGNMQSGMMKEGMMGKCCAKMMKEGKQCCCKDMMSGTHMKMDMEKKDGKMQCPMCAKTNMQSDIKETTREPAPASRTNSEEHKKHH